MTGHANPFFSVVVPVYDRARLLRAAIASVLVQTEQDFEVIIVDDGSTDDPKRVIDEIADSRLHIIRQDNRGGSAARNTGIDLACGRFVAFLDSDDIFLPSHLATMRALVAGSENCACYARIVVDRGQGRTFLKPPRAIAPNEHMASYLMCDRGFVPTTTLVVAREMAVRVRYDETLPFAQDVDFALRLFLAGCRFVMAEAPGAVWHDLPNPDRTSAGRKGARVADWLEGLKPVIPPLAYHGARGWMIAKGVAVQSPARALRLYFAALLRGCYRPRLALVIAMQIFFPDALYRRLADRSIALFHATSRSRAAKHTVLRSE